MCMDFASQPRFFRQGPRPLTRALVCGALSLGLMIADARFQLLENTRESAAVALYPLQWMINAPLAAGLRLAEFVTAQAELERDNHALRNQQITLAARLQRLSALESENAELRQLAGLREVQGGSPRFVEILSLSRDPFSRQLVIDQGTQAGIIAGQPVIDAHGLLGQVTRVAPLTSEVTLITEKGTIVPIQVARNGIRGLLYGDGNRVELRYLPLNADVKEGDLLVTSGLGGVFPAGLNVARVSLVERDAGRTFATIQSEPVGLVDRGRFALVLPRAEREPQPSPHPAPLPPRPADEKPAGKAAHRNAQSAATAAPATGKPAPAATPSPAVTTATPPARSVAAGSPAPVRPAAATPPAASTAPAAPSTPAAAPARATTQP